MREREHQNLFKIEIRRIAKDGLVSNNFEHLLISLNVNTHIHLSTIERFLTYSSPHPHLFFALLYSLTRMCNRHEVESVNHRILAK